MSLDTKILPESVNNDDLSIKLKQLLSADRVSPVSAINIEDTRSAHGTIQQLQLDSKFSAKEGDKKIDPKSKGI